jgi:predicted aminopeptidase
MNMSLNSAMRSEPTSEDEKLLGEFWSALARTLDSAYSAHPDSREVRIRVRHTVYAHARTTLVTQIAPRLRTVSPRYAEGVPLDNASLLARRVYARNLELFDAVYQTEGGNLLRTVSRVIQIAKANRKDPFAGLRTWLRAPNTLPAAHALVGGG